MSAIDLAREFTLPAKANSTIFIDLHSDAIIPLIFPSNEMAEIRIRVVADSKWKAQRDPHVSFMNSLNHHRNLTEGHGDKESPAFDPNRELSVTQCGFNPEAGNDEVWRMHSSF